ncbi:acyl carrier protein [Desulfopila sp. IMCC35006]|uniref:acyl carrier protein n=1 Tax=Desulfopila sp. IMCC35006 TaxID=2569542 RepID=UPI0010AD5B37|nr:acyl carrier protein [Desulfopila sp. IMCC35006]TKB27452.1 acyl carrier protein [Desulfopila sp. IMCC35006]
MKPAEISALVLQAIAQIAPEANLENLDPAARFRDQFDFDSVDCVNLVQHLQQALKVKIPETDYPQLITLDGCVAYLEKLSGGK